MLSFSSIAHGIWIPESTDDLVKKSATIFVGNITATKTLQFEKQYSYLEEENGTDKNIVKNYTLSLDEYTVDVGEYLKNPQNSTKMTVIQPTVGIMGRLGGLDGFKTGDHVLFYLENLDGSNTYSPESFILPTFCNGMDILTQERPAGGINFTVIQNGTEIDYGNFTADEPIQFTSSKDMGTLSGKSYDLEVNITRNSGVNTETMFSKEIHSNSRPCEWTATAEWDFTPQEGSYRMNVITKEGGIITGTSYTSFTAKSNTIHTNHMSPLEQFKSGISALDVKCKIDFVHIIKAEDGSPACVKPNTVDILVKRGWAKPIIIPSGNEPHEVFPFINNTNKT